MWSITTTKTPSTIAIVNGNVRTGAAYPGWETAIRSDGKPMARLISNITGNFLGVYGNYNVADGSPHIVTITYDGSSTAAGVKFYVDDALVSTFTESGGNTLSGSIVDSGAPMWIANQVNFETTFWMQQTSLFGLHVSNVERDATWVAAHANDNAWPDPQAANTVLSLRFGERTGTAANDDSPSNYDATLSSASLWIP